MGLNCTVQVITLVIWNAGPYRLSGFFLPTFGTLMLLHLYWIIHIRYSVLQHIGVCLIKPL